VNKANSLKFCWGISWSSNATTVAGSSNGTGDATNGNLLFPFDISIGNNSIYVLDTGNYRVQLWDSDATSGITVVNGSQGTALNRFDIRE